MRIFRFLLDEDLDRTPECLDSERKVDVSVGIRSLPRSARLAEPRGVRGDGGPLGTSPTKAPPFQSWSAYKLGDDFWDSYRMSDTHKLPKNLVGCSIQITTRNGETWIATVVVALVRRADFVLVRDSGMG